MDRMQGTRKGLAVAAAALGIMASPAGAQEHFDVLLYEDAGGDLAVGAVDVDTLEATIGPVVIEGELLGDTLSATPSFAAVDPGFFSYSDTVVGAGPTGFPAGADNLPGSALVSLDFQLEPTLNLSLAYWDDGTGTWETPAVGETLGLSTLLDPGGSLDGASEVLDMDLATTSATGLLDDHPDFVLSTGSRTGVYLAYGQAEVAGFSGPSDPFWIVFGTLDECEETLSCNASQDAFNLDIEEQIETAISYTTSFLVPEPATSTLAALGLTGLSLLGRRRRI